MYTQNELNNINHEVAHTILYQLGGKSRLPVMVGAHNFAVVSKGLQFDIKARAKNRINKIIITLESSDTYQIKFLSARINKKTYDYEVSYEHMLHGVFCDQLLEILADQTGLAWQL